MVFKRIQWNCKWSHLKLYKAPDTLTFIGIGTNIGTHYQRILLFERALYIIHSWPTTKIRALSDIYETPPWGIATQDSFYNAVVAIESSLNPISLLKALKALEVQLGRKQRLRWGPREIDLDILLMRNQKITLPSLTVPHPQLLHRAFAMVPVLQIWKKASLPNGKQIISALKRSD